jgi:hypothetical protein
MEGVVTDDGLGSRVRHTEMGGTVGIGICGRYDGVVTTVEVFSWKGMSHRLGGLPARIPDGLDMDEYWVEGMKFESGTCEGYIAAQNKFLFENGGGGRLTKGAGR